MKALLFRLVLPVVCLIGTATWMYYYPNIDADAQIKVYTTCWFLIGGALVIMVLSFLSYILNKYIPWLKYPGFRFFFQMLLGTALSIGALNLSYYIIKNYYASAPDSENFIVMNIYASALILPTFACFFGYQFLRDWRRSELKSERLQRENARSQMMSLKNHLDPHFLFNNLNILSSLMDKDLDLSKEYLGKFAEVYRIILQAEHSDLSILEEELQMIDSYIYLLQIRFAESVFFSIDIAESARQKVLPPLSLQMLIENAIKHNMATEQQPITIKIYTEGNEVIVENNLQKKKYDTQTRKGSGLENIKNRYEFFTDKQVQISQTTDLFKVRLPLLEIDK